MEIVLYPVFTALTIVTARNTKHKEIYEIGNKFELAIAVLYSTKHYKWKLNFGESSILTVLHGRNRVHKFSQSANLGKAKVHISVSKH